jgi:hypothetical protein
MKPSLAQYAASRAKVTRQAGSCGPARIVSLLLSLSKAKPCFCLLVGPLELTQPRRAGGPLSVGLRFVQLVALAGVCSLRSQVVQVIGGHALGC